MKRAAVWVAVIAGALTLSGCAGNPDLGPLETELAAVPGVNGVVTWVTHSGAPWNTQVQVQLYVDDTSESGLLDAVRAVAPVLAADDVASRHPVDLRFADGEPSGDTATRPASFDAIAIFPSVFEALGLDARGGEMISLTTTDVRRIADGS